MKLEPEIVRDILLFLEKAIVMTDNGRTLDVTSNDIVTHYNGIYSKGEVLYALPASTILKIPQSRKSARLWDFYAFRLFLKISKKYSKYLNNTLIIKKLATKLATT